MRCYTFKVFLLFAAFLSNFGIANAMFKRSFASAPSVTLLRQNRIKIITEEGRVGQETTSTTHDMTIASGALAKKTFNNPKGSKTVSVQAKSGTDSETTFVISLDSAQHRYVRNFYGYLSHHDLETTFLVGSTLALTVKPTNIENNQESKTETTSVAKISLLAGKKLLVDLTVPLGANTARTAYFSAIRGSAEGRSVKLEWIADSAQTHTLTASVGPLLSGRKLTPDQVLKSLSAGKGFSSPISTQMTLGSSKTTVKLPRNLTLNVELMPSEGRLKSLAENKEKTPPHSPSDSDSDSEFSHRNSLDFQMDFASDSSPESLLSPVRISAERPGEEKGSTTSVFTSSTLERKSPSPTTIMALNDSETDDSETDNTELYGDCPKARAMLPLSVADLPAMPFLPMSPGTPDPESLEAFLGTLRDDQWAVETSMDSTPDSDFRPLPVSIDPEISDFSEDADINI